MSGNHSQLKADTDYLRGLLAYDPSAGTLTWKVTRGSVRAGSIAGCRDKNGYWVVRMDGSNYLSHRVAWQIHHGSPPPLN